MGIDDRSCSRPQAELMVETVTLLAASTVGLAVDGETIPYVAGWGEDGARQPGRNPPERVNGQA